MAAMEAAMAAAAKAMGDLVATVDLAEMAALVAMAAEEVAGAGANIHIRRKESRLLVEHSTAVDFRLRCHSTMASIRRRA